MRVPLAATLGLAGVLVLAACGAPPRYSPAKTRACLAQAGLRVGATPASDVVAQTAPDGTFRVRFAGPNANAVTLSFGDGAKDAQDVADGYVRFHARNVGVTDVLFVDKNVVTLWRRHPSDAERAKITGCLK